MAATAVYASVVRVPLGSVPTENKTFSNISATTASFGLGGGKYSFLVKASTYGTVSLQVLLPDNTTWATAPGDTGESPSLVADGAVTTDLPPGQYRVAIA
jgi:hypothetical protein